MFVLNKILRFFGLLKTLEDKSVQQLLIDGLIILYMNHTNTYLLITVLKKLFYLKVIIKLISNCMVMVMITHFVLDTILFGSPTQNLKVCQQTQKLKK